MTLKVLAVGLTLGLGSAATAAETFAPPQGCTGTLTVQMRQCLVTNVWTCAADAPGEQWVSLFTQEGPWQVRKIDRDFQWLTTYYANPPEVETMQMPAADPSNLDELISTRNDTYDFIVSSDTGNEPERFVGYDRLTGETVQIDGETLLRTEFAYDQLNPAGDIISSAAGRQYVSATHRLFFFGEDWNAATPDLVTDASPVQFIYPGEAGFMSPNPKYDCGAVLSSYGSGQ
jgi:hypothetical protein